MELAGHAPLGATNQAGGNLPLLRLDAVGRALMSVVSIIRTSDPGASNLLPVEPQQPGHHPSPPAALLGAPLW